MSIVNENLFFCPLCKSEEIQESSNSEREVSCSNCGAQFTLVPDPRQATLKLTLKKASKTEFPVGTTLLTLPNMEVVNEFIRTSQGS